MIENIEIKAGNVAGQQAASLLTAAFPLGRGGTWFGQHLTNACSPSIATKRSFATWE